MGSQIQIIRTLFQGTLGPLYWTGSQKRCSGYQLILNSSPQGFSGWKTTLYYHLSGFCWLTGHSWEVSQVDWCWSHLGAWLNLTSKMAYSQSWPLRLPSAGSSAGAANQGACMCPLPVAGPLAAWQHPEAKRTLSDSLQCSLGTQRASFPPYSVVQKAQPRCEHWGVWVTGAEGLFFGEYIPQDRLSIIRATGDYPIYRANKINYNGNNHKTITIGYWAAIITGNRAG